MRFRSFGRPRPGVMNSLEARYARDLEIKKNTGQILGYWYEGIKLRLADKTFYTPDFFVMMADNSLEAHECKGFMMDDANVKLKCAAEKFPFKFILVRWDKAQGWVKREI
jgi:hypothetical protein